MSVFFGVFSSSLGCTVSLQSDLRVGSLKMVNLPEKWKLIFLRRKVFFQKSSISRDVDDIRYVWFFLILSTINLYSLYSV